MTLRILLVDDNPERLRGLQTALQPTEVRVRHPLDVSVDDLSGIDLVSVDEFLGDDWAAATSTGALSEPASIRNVDGLAVAASFRSQSRQSVSSSELDFAVCLHTGELARLAEGLPLRTREPLTAAQHDLDWVFAFEGADLSNRLVQLAEAVQSASAGASDLKADSGASWLGLTSASWSVVAREQIEDCRPPAHALASTTSGRSYVRWLAQRILPYPTFLLDCEYAANLLGITVDSFGRLRETIEFDRLHAKYDGPLDTFLGDRWWRAGVQQLLADAGARQWDKAVDRTTALSTYTNVQLEALPHDQAVVAYDTNGDIADIGADPEQSARLQVDGWPIYADDPWARFVDLADDVDFQRQVAVNDRTKLPTK